MNNIMSMIRTFNQTLFSPDAPYSSGFLSDDLVVYNFLSYPCGKEEFMKAMHGILQAMPDARSIINGFRISGDVVTLTFQVCGMHSAPLDLSFLNLPVLPPSGQLVRCPPAYWEHGVSGDKIVFLRNVGPLGSGLPGILEAFGARDFVMTEI